MDPQELLFWIIVGIFVGIILIAVGNQLLLNLLNVQVITNP